eukprot:CFRG7373T1
MGSTLFNWVTLIVVHALVHGDTRYSCTGLYCVFEFEKISFNLKWVAQLINQVVMAWLFVRPLIAHITTMRRQDDDFGHQNMLKGRDTYTQLVARSIIAAGISVVFTFCVTVCAWIKQIDSDAEIPVFGLAVLNNAVNLYTIEFAVNLQHKPTMNSTSGGAEDMDCANKDGQVFTQYELQSGSERHEQPTVLKQKAIASPRQMPYNV